MTFSTRYETTTRGYNARPGTTTKFVWRATVVTPAIKMAAAREFAKTKLASLRVAAPSRQFVYQRCGKRVTPRAIDFYYYSRISSSRESCTIAVSRNTINSSTWYDPIDRPRIYYLLFYDRTTEQSLACHFFRTCRYSDDYFAKQPWRGVAVALLPITFPTILYHKSRP